MLEWNINLITLMLYSILLIPWRYAKMKSLSRTGLILSYFIFMFGLAQANQTIIFKNGDIVHVRDVKEDNIQIYAHIDDGKEISFYKFQISQVLPKSEYHIALGNKYKNENNYTEAITQYNLALEDDPQNIQAKELLSKIETIYANQNLSIQKERDSLQGALALSKGMALYREGSFGKSVEQFKLALQLLPDNPTAKRYFADATARAAALEIHRIDLENFKVTTEKNLKEFEEYKYTQATAKQMLATNTPSAQIPQQPSAISQKLASDMNITLRGIKGEGDGSEITLLVVTSTSDQELRLKSGDSENIGQYKVRVIDIDTKKQECEIELIPAGSSTGQRIKLELES